MSGNMLNDVELTILSLVAEGQRYGEELEQLIELRGLREWLPVGSASVYYILSRLEQQELVTSTHRFGSDGAEQAAYQITDAGRGVVQTAVADLLRHPPALGEGFGLGLANSGALKPPQVYQALVQHHDDLTHQLHAAEALWARRQQEPIEESGTEALYAYGIAMMQAELAWLSSFIDDWRAKHPMVERDEQRETEESTRTPLHRRTVSADHDKQLQKVKRPKQE